MRIVATEERHYFNRTAERRFEQLAAMEAQFDSERAAWDLSNRQRDIDAVQARFERELLVLRRRSFSPGGWPAEAERRASILQAALDAARSEFQAHADTVAVELRRSMAAATTCCPALSLAFGPPLLRSAPASLAGRPLD